MLFLKMAAKLYFWIYNKILPSHITDFKHFQASSWQKRFTSKFEPLDRKERTGHMHIDIYSHIPQFRKACRVNYRDPQKNNNTTET